MKHAAYFPAYRYFVDQIMAKCRAEGQTGVVCSNSTRRQDASLKDLIAIIPISSLLTVLWPKFDRTEILGWISLSSKIHVVHHNIWLTNLVYSGSSAKSQQSNPTHVCYCFTGGLYYNLIVTVVCSINITTVYYLTVWSSRYTNHCVPLRNGLAGPYLQSTTVWVLYILRITCRCTTQPNTYSLFIFVLQIEIWFYGHSFDGYRVYHVSECFWNYLTQFDEHFTQKSRAKLNNKRVAVDSWIYIFE